MGNLVQLHWQKKDDPKQTEMVAQCDLEEFRKRFNVPPQDSALCYWLDHLRDNSEPDTLAAKGPPEGWQQLVIDSTHPFQVTHTGRGHYFKEMKMMFAMMIGAMMARDAFPTALKAKYGVDLTRYTKAEIEWLFKPMNRERTIEPLVLIMRANALDQDRVPPRKEK